MAEKVKTKTDKTETKSENSNYAEKMTVRYADRMTATRMKRLKKRKMKK